ncbi:MAG: PAS domain S-box protein [Sterolibacterium sp.]
MLAKSLCPDIPFIAVTGAVGDEKAVELLKLGARDYVLKGNLVRLPLAIKRALDEVKEGKARRLAEEAMHRLNRELSAISHCNHILMQAEDEQTLLDDICRIVCDEAGYRMAWVGYAENDDAKTVRPVAWGGFDSGYIADAKLTSADGTERGQSPAGRAIRGGEIICVQDIANDPQIAPWRDTALLNGYRSVIVLPLKDENAKAFGILLIYSTEVNGFTPDEIRLLEELAGDLAFGVTVLRARAEHQRMEQALSQREQAYHTLLKNIPDRIVRYDREMRRIYVNPAWEQACGLSAEEVIGRPPADIHGIAHPVVNEYWEKLEEVLETGTPQAIEMTLLNDRGVTFYMEYRIVPEYDASGKVVGALAVGQDVTERKQADQERLARLRLVESLDRVDRAIQGTNDLDQMLSDVLDATLTIFDCDQAWPVYPCDPDAISWQVPMERTKPEYPGANAQRIEIPMEPGVAGTFRTVLAADGPVKYGPGTKHPLPKEVSERFGFKSFMAMALYPKVGKPWQFGIYQCAYPRVWTPDEEKLLQEIGRRLTDALSTLLAYRDLREGEAKYRSLFEAIPNPFYYKDCDGRFIGCNIAFERYLGISRDEIVGRTAYDIQPKELADVSSDVDKRLIDRPGNLVYEAKVSWADGSLRDVIFHKASFTRADGGLAGIAGIILDITERKAAEKELAKREREFRTLAENSPDPIYRYDRDCRRLYVNAVVGKLIGKPAEALIGTSPADGAILVSEQSRKLMDAIRRVFDSGENDQIDLDFITQAGEHRDYQMLLVPERDEGEHVATVLALARDITAIRTAERRMSHFLGNLPGFVYSFRMSPDGHGSFPFASRGIEDLYGLRPEDVKDDMAPLQALAHPDDRQRIGAALTESARTLTPLLVEVRVRRPGQPERWIECRALPEREADGGILWHGLMLDIDERKRMEGALLDSRNFLDNIIDGIADPIFVKDRQHRWIHFNDAFCRLIGRSREELLGKSDFDFFPEREARVFWDGDEAVFASGREFTNEEEITNEQGDTRHIFTRKTVFTGSRGDPILVGIISDFTERKAAEDQLRKLSQAVEQSPESVVITDIDARIEYVNEAFVKTSGYSREEAIGKNPRILKSGKTPRQTYVSLWDALTHARPWKGELCNQRKDGSEYVEFVRIMPIRQPDGNITHYLAVKEDITEKKHMGEELDRHRHHLEELVASRTAQLAEAREQADAANEAKSAFLANMSHEIRTPLNAVLGLARIGMRENQGRGTGHTYVRILESGQHLLGVINDILDFSKIAAGKLSVERRPFALFAVIDNVKSFVATHHAEGKGLAPVVSLAPNLDAWVEGDAMRLAQILTNLLSNAIKFTKSGEVRLCVARDGNNVCFQVIDSGIGMSEEQLARLFQSFEQADSSTTRNYGGTGLGLAISQSLAHLMGGEISVDSRPGAGSAFTLELPLPAAAVPAHFSQPGGAISAAGPRLAGLSVLAADDVEVNRYILEDLLAHEGARVVFAHDGQQALERIDEVGANAFDVVLMDVQMPVMDGIETARRLATIAPDLPIIGLTAHALAEERDKCLAAGMVEHVTKPIDTDLLVAAIRRHVRLGVSASDGFAPPASAPLTLSTPVAGLIDRAALLARFKGRRAFIARLAASVRKHHAATPLKLREAAGAGNLETLVFIAHSLKGVAGNLDIRPLREAAQALEAAAKDGPGDARTLAGQLADVMEVALYELAELENDGENGEQSHAEL